LPSRGKRCRLRAPSGEFLPSRGKKCRLRRRRAEFLPSCGRFGQISRLNAAMWPPGGRFGHIRRLNAAMWPPGGRFGQISRLNAAMWPPGGRIERHWPAPHQSFLDALTLQAGGTRKRRVVRGRPTAPRPGPERAGGKVFRGRAAESPPKQPGPGHRRPEAPDPGESDDVSGGDHPPGSADRTNRRGAEAQRRWWRDGPWWWTRWHWGCHSFGGAGGGCRVERVPGRAPPWTPSRQPPPGPSRER